jgi:hypothetical protein
VLSGLFRGGAGRGCSPHGMGLVDHTTVQPDSESTRQQAEHDWPVGGHTAVVQLLRLGKVAGSGRGRHRCSCACTACSWCHMSRSWWRVWGSVCERRGICRQVQQHRVTSSNRRDVHLCLVIGVGHGQSVWHCCPAPANPLRLQPSCWLATSFAALALL